MEPLPVQDTTQDPDSMPLGWPAAESKVEPAPPEPSLAPEPTATLETLGTSAQEQDDAVAWLESLAAKHGAKPEELVTDPNARSDTPPDWVEQARAIAESQPQVSTPAKPAPPEPAPEEDRTGMWLRDLAEKETSDEILNEPVKEEISDLTIEQGAPAWMMNLDATNPEGMPTPSTFDQQTENFQRPQEAAPVEELPSAADLPSWLKGLDKEEESEKQEFVEPIHSVQDDSLPAWLKGDDDDTPAPGIPPTGPTDWQPVQLESESEPELVETAPSARKLSPASKPAPEPAESPRSVPRPRQPEAPVVDATLESAQAELNRGDIPTALEQYSKLIKRGRFTEETIRDLREALYRYPVEVTIWQALGDAYMRANRLQEALDAYTKAEELLR